MKISCPSCSAKYSIADEKVQNRLAKIRCRKCGTSIVIDGNVSPASVYAADAGPAPEQPEQPVAAPAPQEAASGSVYSVDLGENDQRQMTVPEIVGAYNSGTITAETYVWADGFPDWMTLGQVDEIVAALHAAANADAAGLGDETSAAAASAAPEESPWEPPPAAANPAPSPAAAMAAPTGPASGGADLFGNVAQAGSESEAGAAYSNPSPSTSPSPSPFGGGAGAATGARNESSVLFSLSALTSGASSSKPSVPAPAPSNNDDSGLIDLKALTESAEAMARPVSTAPAAPSPLGAPAPLGVSASPLGGPGAGVGASMPPRQSKNNTGLYIAGGIVIAAVAVASIITFGGASDEPVAPPAPAVATPPGPVAAAEPTPVPTAAPAPLPSAEAKPPSTGTEEEEAPPTKAAAPKPKSYPRPQPKTTSPAPTASPSPAPKPSPKPATGKCGCRKDDLMCLMNCAQ